MKRLLSAVIVKWQSALNQSLMSGCMTITAAGSCCQCSFFSLRLLFGYGRRAPVCRLAIERLQKAGLGLRVASPTATRDKCMKKAIWWIRAILAGLGWPLPSHVSGKLTSPSRQRDNSPRDTVSRSSPPGCRHPGRSCSLRTGGSSSANAQVGCGSSLEVECCNSLLYCSKTSPPPSKWDCLDWPWIQTCKRSSAGAAARFLGWENSPAESGWLDPRG